MAELVCEEELKSYHLLGQPADGPVHDVQYYRKDSIVKFVACVVSAIIAHAPPHTLDVCRLQDLDDFASSVTNTSFTLVMFFFGQYRPLNPCHSLRFRLV